LLRCVGGPKRPVVTLGLETPLQRDDVIFICSDGLWRAFPIEDIAQRLDSVQMEHELDDLIGRAERKIRKDCDNMTGVALRWESDLTDRKPLTPDRLGEKEQEQLWRDARDVHRQKKQRRTHEPSRENPRHGNVRRDTIESVIEELETYIGNIDRDK
jgi:serine/threonine protein phosphatase PrpC